MAEAVWSLETSGWVIFPESGWVHEVERYTECRHWLGTSGTYQSELIRTIDTLAEIIGPIEPQSFQAIEVDAGERGFFFDVIQLAMGLRTDLYMLGRSGEYHAIGSFHNSLITVYSRAPALPEYDEDRLARQHLVQRKGWCGGSIWPDDPDAYE